MPNNVLWPPAKNPPRDRELKSSQGQLFPRRLGLQEGSGNVTFPSEPGRWWLKKEHSDEPVASSDLCTQGQCGGEQL